jgi:flagellar protein FlgJ
MVTTASIYADFHGLSQLKAQAREDSDSALDKVAMQFESLFTQMMLKSMRDASLGEGIFDNDKTTFYRDLYDQQIALHLSESGGIGLAAVIKRQLGGAGSGSEAEPKLTVNSIEEYRQHAIELAQSLSQQAKIDLARSRQQATAAAATTTSIGVSQEVAAAVEEDIDTADWGPKDFVEQLWPWAKEAADKLGLQPTALLAQAALETGWGRHIMKLGNGVSAKNLFGIKASRGWGGDKANVSTLEYEQGVAVRKKDNFRAYATFRDSFNDYVDFLHSNPRYSKALESTGDARSYFVELQQAGYATDPRYAEKITAVMEGPEMRRAVERLKNMQD